MNAFPERLKRLRERKRIKQYVLSELCGLHRDAVRRYEAGEATPQRTHWKASPINLGCRSIICSEGRIIR